jgi:hypothetical protein
VIQGAGALVGRGGRVFVVTAAHVAMPHGQTQLVAQSDGTQVAFARVDERASRLRLGSLSVAPIGLWVDPRRDLAVLEFAAGDGDELRRSLSPDPAAPIPLLPEAEPAGGVDVEAWGYPAQVHPQVAKPSISASTEEVVVLNAALPRGYSGGPVMVVAGAKKRMVGVVSRADDANHQTTAVRWHHAAALLAAVMAGQASAIPRVGDRFVARRENP